MTEPRTTSHRTEIDGVEVAWSDRPGIDSNAPPLVCLHGLGASSRSFRWLTDRPALEPYRIVTVDTLGHGNSGHPSNWSYTIEDHARLTGELIRHMSPTPVTLFGHSMGGSIGIMLAQRHPSAVSRLIVAEPVLDPGTGMLSGHIARQPESRFVDRGYAALVYQTQRAADRGDAVAAAFLPSLQQVSPVALHRSAVSLRAERSPTIRQHLETLDIPRLLLWGARSAPLTPPLASSAVRQETVPDAGHQMLTDNPDGVVQALLRALQMPPES